MENVIHVEDQSNDEGPYAEITAAVRRQLERNNQAMLKIMEDQSHQTTNDAVKQALTNQAGQGPSTKRQKKEAAFKSRGHRLHYEVNGDILQTVEEEIKAIDNKESDVAKAELEKGKCIITKQQKLIRIADREDNGWEAVKHYLSDELASDWEDEKAISKARKEALDSVNKWKAKKKEQFRTYLMGIHHSEHWL